ncbi:MAG: serine/threonine protein kinase [Anaerolineae bacterium]|nr:serine/threonine protein kinase [Anaerolineae bacterium]
MVFRRAATILEPGQVWQGYQIQRLLGRGTLTEVYRAFSPALNAAVALKILTFRPTDEDKAAALQQRFFQALPACAALDHPGIARVYDYGQAEQHYYIASQLIEGKTLLDVLSERRSGLPQARALTIFRQVAEAVAYAHSRGVAHQDIRPGNILLAGPETPVVVDFGLLRVATGDAQTTAEFSPRAPLYMSPEQASGAEVTPQADIYSLGILLYEMLTGDVPFRGSTPVQILLQHLQRDPRPPSELVPDLDPRVEAAILRAMAKNPADRFSSPLDMVAALEEPAQNLDYETISLTRQDIQQVREHFRQVKSAPPQPAPRPDSVPEMPPAAGEPDKVRWWIWVWVVLALLIVLALGALVISQLGG